MASFPDSLNFVVFLNLFKFLRGTVMLGEVPPAVNIVKS